MGTDVDICLRNPSDALKRQFPEIREITDEYKDLYPAEATHTFHSLMRWPVPSQYDQLLEILLPCFKGAESVWCFPDNLDGENQKPLTKQNLITMLMEFLDDQQGFRPRLGV